MNPTPKVKVALFGIVAALVIAATIGFAVLHTDDFDSSIRFTLQDHAGAAVTEQNIRGNYVLAYFGFTNCPRICPTQMARITSIVNDLDRLPAERLVTPVFITVDPERDTVDKVHDYIEHFHPRFVGLTGSRVALESAALSFKSKLPVAPIDSATNYDVVHPSVIYLIDPAGRLVTHIPFESSVQDSVDRIKEYLL